MGHPRFEQDVLEDILRQLNSGTVKTDITDVEVTISATDTINIDVDAWSAAETVNVDIVQNTSGTVATDLAEFSGGFTMPVTIAASSATVPVTITAFSTTLEVDIGPSSNTMKVDLAGYTTGTLPVTIAPTSDYTIPVTIAAFSTTLEVDIGPSSNTLDIDIAEISTTSTLNVDISEISSGDTILVNLSTLDATGTLATSVSGFYETTLNFLASSYSAAGDHISATFGVDTYKEITVFLDATNFGATSTISSCTLQTQCQTSNNWVTLGTFTPAITAATTTKIAFGETIGSSLRIGYVISGNSVEFSATGIAKAQ